MCGSHYSVTPIELLLLWELDSLIFCCLHIESSFTIKKHFKFLRRVLWPLKWSVHFFKFVLLIDFIWVGGILIFSDNLKRELIVFPELTIWKARS